MNSTKLLLDINYGNYSCKGASNIEMNILGNFLAIDVGCLYVTSYKEWALADKEDPNSQFIYSYSADATYLEEENNYIYLEEDISSGEETPPRLKITKKQFVQLLDDWQELVCKTKPKEVIIKHEHGHFFIETSDVKWEKQ
jgi:hypothetical protein